MNQQHDWNQRPETDIQEVLLGQGDLHCPLVSSSPYRYIVRTSARNREDCPGLPVEDDLSIISKHRTIFKIHWGCGWAGSLRE